MPKELDNNLSLSVFFPCYNDAESIAVLVDEAFSLLPSITSDFEVIVIDDGSVDNSPEVLRQLKKSYPNLKLIFHEKNRGYGGALKSGFRACGKDFVFYTDGDGQYDIGELPLLTNLVTSNVDFINGFKTSRQDPLPRILLGNLYSFITRWLFWLPVVDTDCDFRLIKTSLLRTFDLRCQSGAICVELIKKAQRAGARFREVSVNHRPRRFGRSQFFKIRRLIQTLGELVSLWLELMIFNKVFSKRDGK